ncbi:protein downstream neighbor of Son-like isoform X1 [Selaginella moellendorffii]|uniref:protein downstream neighbor of Son-like isoform X1 n=1 Tax=Selaginella moellendorffii TaxID=88036 RepID=UPI000D1C48AD|nr:protein downstream neighbor of Son-like isoform X1 [Selaginella moellendorffii]|eukprot:XP_024526479.1 protein downstream neighbor of Son-like isoform X1 [Selaginella moellendorffii]
MEWRGGADRAASGAESDASPSLGKRKTPSELRREQLKRANSQDAGSAQRPDAPKPPRFSETRASDVCAPTKSAEKPKFSLSKYKDEHSTKGKEIKQNQGEASTSNSKFKNVAELSCRIQQPQASPAVDMAEAIKALAVIKAPEKVPRPISRSSSAPAEFDNQRTKKLPVLPLDLTLKLTARFLSCTSFHWCHRFGVQNQFQGLKEFIESGLGVENPHGHKASEVESDFWKGLHSWVYPQLSFPPEVLSALMSPAARAAGNSFLEQRQRDWEDSFHSLYYAFRNKLCNIFYFCGSQFVVAFLCGRSQEQICAYLSRSTRGLRALLQKQGVSFSMPLCKLDSKPASAEELQELSEFEKLNPGQTRLVDSMAAVDNSVQSLLAFNGSQSVHRLYDFLLNYRFFVGSMTRADVPVLYSPVPFHNASLKVPEVCSKQMQVIDGSAVSTNNSYSLEIKATCLAPWVISRLCVALRRLHKETFEVSFTTEPLSEGLNIAQLHEEAACNELGFGRASTFASGSIRQIKCIDGSYVATVS